MDAATAHRAWEDLKLLFLHREDRERRERGLPPLEVEFEQEADLIRGAFDPPVCDIRISA
ncbi:MAG TPA: hypothetical protein VIU82_21995 [Bosea sp. (in: a-proteobacteria)]